MIFFFVTNHPIDSIYTTAILKLKQGLDDWAQLLLVYINSCQFEVFEGAIPVHCHPCLFLIPKWLYHEYSLLFRPTCPNLALITESKYVMLQPSFIGLLRYYVGQNCCKKYYNTSHSKIISLPHTPVTMLKHENVFSVNLHHPILRGVVSRAGD